MRIGHRGKRMVGPGGWPGRALRVVHWLLGLLVLGLALGVQAQVRPLPSSESLPRVAQSPALQAWLTGRGAVRLGVVPDWRPIDQIDAGGRYTGLSGDLLAAVGRMLDLPVQLRVFDDFPQLMAALRSGDIDLVASMARSEAREAELLFSDSYVDLPVVYIGRRGVTDFSERNDFGGRRVAVERGHVTHEYLQSRHRGTALVLVDNTRQALQAVAEGRADFYLGSLAPAHHVIESDRLDQLEVLRTTPLSLGSLHLAMPRGAEPLRDALNEALRRLDPAWLEQLSAAWQPRYLLLTPARAVAVEPATRAQVAAIGELRVGFDRGFGPIASVGEDGEPTGFAVELFRRAARHAGLNIRFEPQRTFEAGLNGLRDQRLDVLLAAVRTPPRQEFADFVGPFYSAPSVLVSRLDGGWPSVASLAGRTLAMDRAHYLIPVIQREAPAVRILEVETVETAMERVAQGQADAMITNLEVAASFINKRFLGQLQVSGTVEGRPSELYFAVRKDMPAVAALLRRGLDAMPENDQAALANTWLRTEFRAGVPWSRIVLVVLPVLAVLLTALAVSLLYNRRLKAQVEARQAAELQLQRERDTARAATAAKADFLAEMGHEVRTPLSAISGGLELLQRQELPPAARPLVMTMARAAGHLVELLNNLLDVAKLEAHKISLHTAPGNVGTLVRDLADEFMPSAQAKGLTLDVLGAQAWTTPVLCDAMRLRQVVGNLLANAIKFTERGSVRVHLSPPVLREQMQWIEIRVEDTGPGMSREVRDGVFERFAQAPDTARRHGGTGLGLAIVRELTELMGGRVEVMSIEGQGSTFTVHLPLPPAAPASLQPAGSVRRVLLVEDAPVNQMLYAEQLRSRGFLVNVASSAEEALRSLASEPVDLVVTDLQLPGMPGAELAVHVADMHLRACVVALTADDGSDARTRWGDRFDLFLTKPRSPADTVWLDQLCARFAPPSERRVQGTPLR